MRFENFLYYDFDLAIGNQICWSLLHGSLDCSIRGGPFLGDHFRPIFFLLVPLYGLFPSPLFLLFLQSLALGGAAVPVYLIGKRLINGAWGALFALLYLLYPATGYVNNFEFHPVALATFFFAMAAYGWVKERLWIYYLFSILALFCREEMALVILFFALYGLIVKRRWTWSFLPLAVACTWFALCMKVFIPHFRQGPFEYFVLFSQFGDTFSGALVNIAQNPVEAIRFFFMPPKPLTLFQLLFPVLFLPILSPLALLPAVPIVLRNFLSSYHTAWTLYYQYTAAVIPFIFLSSIYAVRKLLLRFPARAFRATMAVTLASASVVSSCIMGPLPRVIGDLVGGAAQPGDVAVLRSVVDSLEGEEGIVATFRLLPMLSSRSSLYPFHYVMWGRRKLSPEPFILPADVGWAAIDFADPLTFKGFYRPDMSSNVRAFVDGGKWGVVELLGPVAVLKKGEKDRYNLIEPERTGLPPNKVGALSTDLIYGGYEVSEDEWEGSPVVSLSCYWEARKTPETNYTLIAQVMDERGRVLETLAIDLGYYLLPSASWRKGQKFRSFYRIPLSAPPQDGNVSVRVALLDGRTGKMVSFSSTDGSKSAWLPAGSLFLTRAAAGRGQPGNTT